MGVLYSPMQSVTIFLKKHKKQQESIFLLDIDDWVYIINKYRNSLNNFLYLLIDLNHFFLL